MGRKTNREACEFTKGLTLVSTTPLVVCLMVWIFSLDGSTGVAGVPAYKDMTFYVLLMIASLPFLGCLIILLIDWWQS